MIEKDMFRIAHVQRLSFQLLQVFDLEEHISPRV